MPSGRFPPLRLGTSTRRTGIHCHRSKRIASIILAILSSCRAWHMIAGTCQGYRVVDTHHPVGAYAYLGLG